MRSVRNYKDISSSISIVKQDYHYIYDYDEEIVESKPIDKKEKGELDKQDEKKKKKSKEQISLEGKVDIPSSSQEKPSQSAKRSVETQKKDKDKDITEEIKDEQEEYEEKEKTGEKEGERGLKAEEEEGKTEGEEEEGEAEEEEGEAEEEEGKAEEEEGEAEEKEGKAEGEEGEIEEEEGEIEEEEGEIEEEEGEIEEEEGETGRIEKKERYANYVMDTSEGMFVYTLSTEFTRAIERLISEYRTTEIEGIVSLSMKKLIRRVLNKKSFYDCFLGYVPYRILIMFDNSGSMSYWCDVCYTSAKIFKKSNMVDIIFTPNGCIDEKDTVLLKNYYEAIMYIGDFDGGDTPYDLKLANKNTRVIWICTETRYKDTLEHSWCNHSLEETRRIGVEIYNAKNYKYFLRTLRKIK